ncbi:hypothetical protein HDU67_003066, partial [Dinochytrium kinnereticum]
MLSNIVNSGPAVILHYDSDRQVIAIHSPSLEQSRWNQSQLEEHFEGVFRSAMADCGTHPDRLIYALAGRTFNVNSPRPIGGKKNPGFAEYSGTTPEDLLQWLVTKAAEPPNTGRGRKRTAPGEALKFIVEQLNELMGLQRNRHKDAMDDAILKGMSKAGHIKSSGRIVIPQYLREDEGSPQSGGPNTPLSQTQSIDQPALQTPMTTVPGREIPDRSRIPLVDHSATRFQDASQNCRYEDR